MLKQTLRLFVLLVLVPGTAKCGGVLSLTLGTNVISEAQVVNATVATVTTDTTITNANGLSVGIFSDATQVTVPTCVTIPVGTNAVRFSVGAVNNGIIDGTRTNTLRVTADTWTSASATLTITDDDTPTHLTIGGNLVGHLATNVYWVTAPLTIKNGQTLTLDPSSTLFFAAGTGLTNNGTLLAVGSAGAEILFTSAVATPTNGSWNGIAVNSSGAPQSILGNVEVSFATTGVSVTPSGNNASLLITNSSFHNCSINALDVVANTTISIGPTAVQILSNQIYDNGNFGVRIFAFVNGNNAGTVNSTSVIGNDIFGNASAGIRLNASASTGLGCNNCISRGRVNSLVSNNSIHGNVYGIWGNVVKGYLGTIGSLNPTIENNLIINNTKDGVRLDADQGGWESAFAEMYPKIANTTIVGNAGSGISRATNAVKGFSICNNLVAENNYGMTVDAAGVMTNVLVGFNDVWANGQGNWVNYPQYGSSVTNNLNGTPADPSLNICADPLLGGVDGYHLSAGSPAVDAGTTNSAPATDAEGHARLGPPDMGCFELPQPVLTSVSAPGSGFGVVITGGRGLNYAMEATTNFANWFALTNLTMTNGVMRSSLPVLSGQQHLFYRAKLIP
jgi:hypothetical protein